ncbi:MAG: hypothetical protein ACOYIP_05925 [Coriobacteriales bacterium]
MADISIIVPLDGSRAQFLALCDSMAKTEEGISQIVVVKPSGNEIEDVDFGALPVEPLVIEANGTLGELWNAGVAACTSEYVYPASCRIRFSKAFYHVCCAQVTRAPVDLLFFHLQEFDLATQSYSTTRPSMRLSIPAEPFAPSQYGRHLIQRLSANACSAVFSKRFLAERGFSFSAVASFDDDPGLPRLIASAESISRLPWPLVVLAYDSGTMFDEVGDDAFMERYACFVREYGESLPLGPAFDSFIEWAVAFASRHIEHAPNDLGNRMLESMGENILPIIAEHLENRRDTVYLEGADYLLLSNLSRRELIDMVRETRTMGAEESYRAEMLEIAVKRLSVGDLGSRRPKKKGLFRR